MRTGTSYSALDLVLLSSIFCSLYYLWTDYADPSNSVEARFRTFDGGSRYSDFDDEGQDKILWRLVTLGLCGMLCLIRIACLSPTMKYLLGGDVLDEVILGHEPVSRPTGMLGKSQTFASVFMSTWIMATSCLLCSYTTTIMGMQLGENKAGTVLSLSALYAVGVLVLVLHSLAFVTHIIEDAEGSELLLSHCDVRPRYWNWNDCLSVGKKTVMASKTDDVEWCSICLIEFEQDVRTLPCGHIYHDKCIDSWLWESMNCPLCKESFAPKVTIERGRGSASSLQERYR